MLYSDGMGIGKLVKKTEKKHRPSSLKQFQTPFLLLDFSLGSGIPEGMFIEAFAPEGLGKTTLLKQTMSFYLYQYPNEIYFSVFDVEKSIDYNNLAFYYFQAYDPNTEFAFDDETGLVYINGEEIGTYLLLDTYEEVEKFFNELANVCIEEKKKGIIVWDSLVSATTEKTLKDGSEGLGYKARAIQSFLEKNYPKMRRVPITMLTINQIREKIKEGLFSSNKDMGAMIEGDIHLAGGRYHKFMAHQALQLVYKGKWTYSSNERMVGKKIGIIPTKNKSAPDRREVQLVFIRDYGFSNIVSLIEFLKDKKLFSGSFAQGKFTENEELHNLISDGNKTFSLEKLVNKILENEEVLDMFYNYVFEIGFDHYKETPRKDRYTEEVRNNQKLAIKLDGYKLKYYLENIFK